MSQSHSVRFDEVLEAVEALPEEQQEGLIDIVRRRQIERRRDPSLRASRRRAASWPRALFAEGRWTSCSASSDP